MSGAPRWSRVCLCVGWSGAAQFACANHHLGPAGQLFGVAPVYGMGYVRTMNNPTFSFVVGSVRGRFTRTVGRVRLPERREEP